MKLKNVLITIKDFFFFSNRFINEKNVILRVILNISFGLTLYLPVPRWRAFRMAKQVKSNRSEIRLDVNSSCVISDSSLTHLKVSLFVSPSIK